jgi:hypothetical protein
MGLRFATTKRVGRLSTVSIEVDSFDVADTSPHAILQVLHRSSRCYYMRFEVLTVVIIIFWVVTLW